MAMMDARCPKCGRRIGWQGRAVDRPGCWHCGHQVPRSELEDADRQIEACREEMLREAEKSGAGK
jgi:hypothetical protein